MGLSLSFLPPLVYAGPTADPAGCLSFQSSEDETETLPLWPLAQVSHRGPSRKYLLNSHWLNVGHMKHLRVDKNIPGKWSCSTFGFWLCKRVSSPDQCGSVVWCCLAKLKGAGSVPGQDTCLGYRPGPSGGACKRQPSDVSLTDRSLSLSLSLLTFLSL